MEPDVSKMLASAVKTCKKGNRIVLDLETGSYIKNKTTHKKTPLYVKGDTFKFNIWRPKQALNMMEQAETQNKIDEVLKIPTQTRSTHFHRQVRVQP